MYVQINKETRDSLQKNVIAEMMMGSHAHGLATKDSDKDVLYIYYDRNYGQNIFWESNGWQYKADGVDENYQELRVFIRNLITAKMCGNLEALLGEWKFTEHVVYNATLALNILFIRLTNLKSYAITKSYLGYVKKDLKIATTIFQAAGIEKSDESNEFRKKLTHIIRGLNTVGYLLGETEYLFTPNSSLTTEYETALFIKNGSMKLTAEWVESFMRESESTMNQYRDKLNSMLNAQQIARRGANDQLNVINSTLEYALTLLTGTDIVYDESLRFDIVEKGESHQYM